MTAPGNVTVTIDGRAANVPPGTTILEAAKGIGVSIPHFCWHPNLSISGNCRMCLVEVEKSPKLLPACHARVSEGMIVRTDTARVAKVRQAVMEFLFINHPVDCPICDKAGECKLQDYYMAHQKQLSRFREEKVVKVKAQPIGPRIVYDGERCIVCTRCVRFMKEIVRDPQLCVVKRTDRSYISTAPGRAFDHPYSLNTVDLCPVGALTSREFRFKMRVWFLAGADSVCTGCSRGCSIALQHHHGTAHRMLPRDNPLVNDCWLCDDGRLTYRRMNESRLRTAVERQGDDLLVIDMRAAARQAGQTMAEDLGKICVAVSPQATCEDCYALLRFARDVLRVNEVYLTGRADWPPDDILKRADANPNRRGVSEIAAAMGFRVLDTGALVKAAEAAAFETLIALGADVPDDSPAVLELKKFETVIVLAEHAKGLCAIADLAIPLAHPGEQDATFVNADGLVQRIRPCGRPGGRPAPAWRTLGEIAAAMDREIRYPDAAAVFSALAAEVPFFAGMAHASIPALGAWGAGVVPPERERLCTPR